MNCDTGKIEGISNSNSLLDNQTKRESQEYATPEAYRIRIICCYMGSLPQFFPLFYDSLRNNSWIDWMIVTDTDYKPDKPAKNVSFVSMTLHDIELRIKNKIGDFAQLKFPYKLCDYRPAYALIFSDYLDGYSHWGWCDCDVVFGDLQKFITPKMLADYDKIFSFGHLSIIKNNKQMQEAFRLRSNNSQNYEKVFSSALSCWFDEYHGINELLTENGYSAYTGIDFFDISDVYRHRMSVADKKVLQMFFPDICHRKNMIFQCNYNVQLFLLDKGRIKRAVYDRGQIRYEEAAYIHFRRKIDIREYRDLKDSYAFTIEQLMPLGDGCTISDIKRLNGNSTLLEDYLDYCLVNLKRKWIRTKAWVYQEVYLNQKNRLKCLLAKTQT